LSICGKAHTLAEEPVRRTSYPHLKDPEVLRNLIEVRMTERLSWPDLAAYYLETYGEEIHFTTIKRALMNNASTWLVPERVNKAVKLHIENIWEKVDLLQLVTVAFQAKFTEWYQYYEKMVQSWLEEVNVDPEQRRTTKVFTEEERKRMDKLWEDLISFFFRMANIMRELKAPGSGPSSLEMLLAKISGQVSGSLQGEHALVEPAAGGLTVEAIALVMKQVSDSTKSMLEGVHARHQLGGRGFYRQIPEIVDAEAEEE
jgi:hypothetical protein